LRPCTHSTRSFPPPIQFKFPSPRDAFSWRPRSANFFSHLHHAWVFTGAPQRVSSFHHKACYEIHTIVILVALIHRPSPRRVSHRSGNRSVEAKSTHSPPFPPERSRPRPRTSFFRAQSVRPIGFRRDTRQLCLWPTVVSYQPLRTVLAYKALWRPSGSRDPLP